MKPVLIESVLGTTAMTNDEFASRVLTFMYSARSDREYVSRRNALAREFEVSRDTMDSWAHGDSRPHPLLQSQVVRWIEENS